MISWGGLVWVIDLNRWRLIRRPIDPELAFQFAPVAFLEAIQPRRRCGSSGVHITIERLVAFAHLLPLAYRKTVAVAAGDQLLGAELLDELGVDLGQMDEPGWKHRGRPVLAHIRANGRRSDAALLCKLTGYTIQSIRYVTGKLIEDGLIRRVPRSDTRVLWEAVK